MLAGQIPRTGRLAEGRNLQSGKLCALQGLLDGHRDEFHVTDLGLATFVCVTSIEAPTHKAVLHYSDMLRNEAVEALVDEVTRLVGYGGARYLRGERLQSTFRIAMFWHRATRLCRLDLPDARSPSKCQSKPARHRERIELSATLAFPQLRLR